MNGPIDYDSPLGISKREWAKVLGANLALLLIAYAVALIFTMSGSDFFISSSTNSELARIESALRSIHLFAIVQILFSAVEEMIVLCYVMKSKPRWWWSVAYIALAMSTDLLFTHTIGYFPSFMPLINGIAFALTIIFIRCLTAKQRPFRMLARLGIAIIVTAALNVLISLLRTKVLEIGHAFPNTQFFYLSVEYDLALSLSLGFLTMIINWEKGERKWTTTAADAGGSSQTSMRCSRKNSAKQNNLPESAKKRLMLLKAKVIAVQTLALVFIVALPIAVGKATEFALLYVSFCVTRMILTFRHSLHFKSELSCVTIGALVFWGLTYLAPSAEASIIISLAYGAGLALGFRLYWELHDLIMYRKAAKTDRYAMLYTALKGNTDPMHIRGVMRLRGHQEADEIKMVQMYMAKEKVDYIAQWLNMPLRSVDRRLTELSEELYARR